MKESISIPKSVCENSISCNSTFWMTTEPKPFSVSKLQMGNQNHHCWQLPDHCRPAVIPKSIHNPGWTYDLHC